MNTKVLNGMWRLLVALVVCFSFAGIPAYTVQSGGTAQPAHYIVFERGADGRIVPAFYLPVELSAPLQNMTESRLAEALAEPQRNADLFAVSLEAGDGRVVYQNIVPLSPWLRAEFHGKQSGDPIDGTILPAEKVSFVVRVPIIQGTRLILKDSLLTTVAEFDLARLAADTPRIQLDKRASVDKGSMTGPAANRVDLLVMGDGYTAAQSAQFLTDAANSLNQFFSISPYAEYKNYFNTLSLFTASNQSGADHPIYNPSCGYYDPTCCGDPAMLSDPLHGLMVNTAFDSRYCAYYIHRLLVADNTKVFAAAAAVPDWDTILLIVNDTTYGGSGGEISVVSMHTLAPQIAQHEFGHSFVGLADEYDTAYPGYPACSDVSGPACESNVTDVTNPALIKWNPWILGTTPIPTPETGTYSGLVGLFEGARYLSTGMYRSGLNCIMQSLGSPYCQVPSQSFVLTLYTGGWGVPAPGISLIEPGTMSPASNLIYLYRPASQTFHADSLSPSGGPASQISWYMNGVVIPGETTDTYTYTTSPADPTVVKITMRVNDVTTLVNSSMAGGALQDEYTWTVILDPKTYKAYSASANDGWILETGENTNKGGTLDSAAATLRLGDDAMKKQYRSILSFATGASLPDTAVITKVTLKVKKQGITGGGNPVTAFQGFMVDIKKGLFGTSALQATDFQAGGVHTYGPFTTALSGGWYTIDLTAGKAYINKLATGGGLTQIRLRFKLDDNNNTVANYLSLHSGDAAAAKRPQLIIEYYVP